MDRRVKRIEFYTRKVAELVSIHPTKRDARWKTRQRRLLNYKEKMNQWLKEYEASEKNNGRWENGISKSDPGRG